MDTESAIQAACELLQNGDATQALSLCDAQIAASKQLSIEQLSRWELVQSWAFTSLRQHDAALEHVERSLQLNPTNVHAHLQHAEVLRLLGQREAAFLALRRCSTLAPNSTALGLQLGRELHMRGHYQEAWKYYQAALREEGFTPDINLSVSFIQAADYASDELAADKLRAHLQRTPGWVTTPHHLWLEGFRAFKQGDFAKAWELYDQRHHDAHIAQSHAFALPDWDGVYRRGETLLVHGEQGLGDEIMFAGSLPHLLAQTDAAGVQVILAVKPGLCRLFRHNFPQCLVVPHHHTQGLLAKWPSDVKVNAHIPLANLPRLFLRSLSDFERNAHPYLAADPTAITKFDGLLNTLVPHRHDKLLVGLVWACAQGKNPELDARAIPAEQLAALGDFAGVQFVSLHNQDHAAEAARVPTLNILDLGLWHQDFYDTAGLIHHMDLVIGVDTATTHLAGAMGKRVLQPLLKYPDWRRQTPGDQCIWYRNTTYYRQTTMFSWFDVLAAIRGQIEQTVQSFHSPHPLPL